MQHKLVNGSPGKGSSGREVIMDKGKIRKAVLDILNDIVPAAETASIDPDMSFHDQFGIDSIDFLRLMMELEKECNVVIPDYDYPKLSTLRGCENYLGERLAA